MNCPKCGGNMEKGYAAFPSGGGFGLGFYICWFFGESVKKFSKFPHSLLAKPDLYIFGKKKKMGYHGLEAYRCANCGAVLLIPPKNDEK